jgi:type I restriction enzyme, S subunit
MSKYLPYPEYKDSGVEWLGEVPKDWEIGRLKFVLKSIIAGGTPKTDNDLNWCESGDGIPWVSIADMTKNYLIETTKKDVTLSGVKEKNLKILPEGTLLYSIFASLGKVAIAKTSLTTNQAILGLVPNKKISNAYLYWLLVSLEEYVHFTASSNTQDNLNAEKVANFPIVLPLSEQQSIANFLDIQTSKIDALISKQEQMIELLNEKRKAIISHSVTKGINPDVKMKDSGVEWIGEIPVHWEITAIKRIVSTPVTDGPHETPNFVDNGIPFISAEAVSKGVLDFDKQRGYITEELNKVYSQKYSPQLYDIYMIKSGSTTGVSAIVETDKVFNIWSPLAVIRCKQTKAYPYFILNFMRSRNFLQAIELGWSFGTQQNIGMGVIENISTVLPPLEEQYAIACYLQEKNQKFDLLIEKAKQAIELLKERRSSLISAAVTGKIDVRHTAAN